MSEPGDDNEKQPRVSSADGPTARDDENYQLAPLPETFEDAESAAYRPAAPDDSGQTYEVGPEVDERPYSVAAQSWREAAAGVKNEVDEFGLAPEDQPSRLRTHEPVSLSAERRLAELQDRRIGDIDDPNRFTLRGLFILITALSVILAIGTRLPRSIFAGIMGGAAFATLVVGKWLRAGGALFNLAWYTLLGLYLLISLFAALRR
jgi:hypothetical protein